MSCAFRFSGFIDPLSVHPPTASWLAGGFPRPAMEDRGLNGLIGSFVKNLSVAPSYSIASKKKIRTSTLHLTHCFFFSLKSFQGSAPLRSGIHWLLSRLPNLYSVQFIPSIVSLFFLLLILYEVLEQGLTDPDNTRLVHLSQVCNSRSDWIRPLQPKKDPSCLPNLRSGQSVPVSPIFSALLDFVFFFFFSCLVLSCTVPVMYACMYLCM